MKPKSTKEKKGDYYVGVQFHNINLTLLTVYFIKYIFSKRIPTPHAPTLVKIKRSIYYSVFLQLIP